MTFIFVLCVHFVLCVSILCERRFNLKIIAEKVLIFKKAQLKCTTYQMHNLIERNLIVHWM